jgi:MFS family permease
MNQDNGSHQFPPLRKNVRFQLLWLGSGISKLGDAAVNLALPILILFATGSPVLAGLAATVSLASSLILGVPAGALVDRIDRRRILLLAETGLALTWGVFAAIVYLDAVALWNVVLVAALGGTAAAFIAPAQAASIQALVPKPQLAGAYAQAQARAYAIQLGGPPIGGLLYAISRAAPFAFQVVASIVSILCYLGARVPRRPLDEGRREPADDVGRASRTARARQLKQDVREALRWLLEQRGLRAVFGMAFFLNPIVNAIWVPIIVLVTARGGEAVDVGIIMAGVGVGGLIGSLLAARLSRWIPAGKLVLLVGFVMGVSYVLIPLPLGTYWPMVPVIVSTLAAPALNVAIMALLGNIVPSSMMGRMSSLMNLAFQGFTPLGPILGGVLAASLGGGGALIVCGVALLLVTLAASASSALRNLRVPDATTEEPAAPADADTPGHAKEVPQLDPEMIQHLHEVGIINTKAEPLELISSLSADEAALLASLSIRIKAESDPDGMARSRAGETTPAARTSTAERLE